MYIKSRLVLLYAFCLAGHTISGYPDTGSSGKGRQMSVAISRPNDLFTQLTQEAPTLKAQEVYSPYHAPSRQHDRDPNPALERLVQDAVDLGNDIRHHQDSQIMLGLIDSSAKKPVAQLMERNTRSNTTQPFGKAKTTNNKIDYTSYIDRIAELDEFALQNQLKSLSLTKNGLLSELRGNQSLRKKAKSVGINDMGQIDYSSLKNLLQAKLHKRAEETTQSQKKKKMAPHLARLHRTWDQIQLVDKLLLVDTLEKALQEARRGRSRSICITPNCRTSPPAGLLGAQSRSMSNLQGDIGEIDNLFSQGGGTPESSDSSTNSPYSSDEASSPESETNVSNPLYSLGAGKFYHNKLAEGEFEEIDL